MDGYSWPEPFSFYQVVAGLDGLGGGVDMFRFRQDLPTKVVILSQHLSMQAGKLFNTTNSSIAGLVGPNKPVGLYDFTLDIPNLQLLGYATLDITPKLLEIDPYFSVSNLAVPVRQSDLTLMGDQRIAFIEFALEDGGVIDEATRTWHIEFRTRANNLSSVQFWTCYFNSDHTKFYEMYKVNSGDDHFNTFKELFAIFGVMPSAAGTQNLIAQNWYYFARPGVDLTNANDPSFLPPYSDLTQDSQDNIWITPEVYPQVTWPQVFNYQGSVTTESTQFL